ncbi:isoprenyl transferase [Bacteroidales bacterium OttesenSCG-928-I21]|nr:isoprenyl transferase [Bacteroidales bacterium OttesenSCG-928-I21]
MSLKDKIDLNKIPKHVAVIMDGNGRWAKARGEIRLNGHHAGARTVKSTLQACGELGIKNLTVYAFSTENWNRPQLEINGLMNLLVSSIDKEIDEIHKSGVKVTVVGEIEKLPKNVQKKINYATEQTKNNQRINFIIAISYSGRWEIINAVKQIAEEYKIGKINIDEITETTFSNYLTTNGIPDPELLIRTSGEERISNFLLYQLAYTELYFTDTLWPDFSKEDFYAAIIDFQSRERRFGKTSDQINK